MNDLAFGTTLLASFAALIAAVIIEFTSPAPTPRAATAQAGARPAPQLVANAGSVSCADVALASASVR